MASDQVRIEEQGPVTLYDLSSDEDPPPPIKDGNGNAVQVTTFQYLKRCLSRAEREDPDAVGDMLYEIRDAIRRRRTYIHVSASRDHDILKRLVRNGSGYVSAIEAQLKVHRDAVESAQPEPETAAEQAAE